MKSINAPLFLLALAGIVFFAPNASAQIVAFGHSAVRGPVSESDMWPAVLEGLLRAKGSQTRVINAGVYGETTDRTLMRVSSDIPEGTKIVILADNGHNDVKRNMTSAQAKANIAAIKSQLTARHIRIIDAMPLVHSTSIQPQYQYSDHLHLNVEGNKKVATVLAGMVR